MRLKIFIFSLILISINDFFAQNLKGIYVLNEITKKPISSVLISDFNDGFQEVSDENGFVSLQNFNYENQKIYVSGIGYEKEEFNLNSIKKEKDFKKETLEKFLQEKRFNKIEINKIKATIEDSFILLLSNHE